MYALAILHKWQFVLIIFYFILKGLNSMLMKWAIGGAFLGLIGAYLTDTNVGSGIVFGAILAVIIRKWIFRNLWM